MANRRDFINITSVGGAGMLLAGSAAAKYFDTAKNMKGPYIQRTPTYCEVCFWKGGVVVFGLIFPFILEVLELRGKKIPAAISAMMILIGSLIFRFVMVDAGQLTRYLY